MSCDVAFTDIQPLSLTRPRGSQEKHVSLNLRPLVFSELKGGRGERRMLIVPKAKLTGISPKGLNFTAAATDFLRAILAGILWQGSCWQRLLLLRVILKVFPPKYNFLSLCLEGRLNAQ